MSVAGAVAGWTGGSRCAAMKVAVDVNDLRRPQSGIGRYVCGLLHGFRQLGGTDEFLLLHKDPLSLAPLGEGDVGSMAIRRQPSRSETWWGQVVFGRAAMAWGASVLFCPAVRAPVLHALPLVLTVHDVIFAVHPELYTAFPRTYMSWLMRLVLPRCERIIAVSGATKRDLVQQFDVAPDRIEVVYHGIEERFHPRSPEEARAALARHNLNVPAHYVLFVGTLEPRKNVARLLQAFEMAARHGLSHKLVLAGRRGWLDRDVMAAIERGQRLGFATYLGHVPDGALPDLYAAADAVVYPSRYEGFGFPVLEGMASGVPVVTARAPGVAEVAAGACLTVEPDDAQGLVGAIEAAVSDEGVRGRLIGAGLERAKRFSWRECALRTRQVLERASREGHARGGRPSEAKA